MKLKIEQVEWDSAFNRNVNPHSRNAFLIAKQWAEMMEEALEKGEQFNLCANRTLAAINSSPISGGGISGTEYGMILRLLGRAWQHGEQLIEWHNRMNLN